MAWKLLKLKPLKPFFFGKETNLKNTNHAISEYFPQQTQLTGALRLYSMEINSLMKVYKSGRFCVPPQREKALELVGDANSHNFITNDNLGKFDFISPMFIIKTKGECIRNALFEIPSDIVKKDNCYIIATPKKLSDITSSKTTTLLQNYDVKEGFVNALGGIEFWDDYIEFKNPKNIIQYSEVFEPYKQVGIGLKNNKQVNEGQFYTKISYNLKENYEFGVIIKSAEENLIKNGIITLGGENSTFKLEVLDIPYSLKCHPIIQNFQNDRKQKGKKIVLLSDSILTNSINENAFFQIVEHKVLFKMMISQEEKTIETEKGTFTKHQRYNTDKKSDEKLLVPKGTIYYFNTPSTIEEATGAYKKMGFNTFLILNT